MSERIRLTKDQQVALVKTLPPSEQIAVKRSSWGLKEFDKAKYLPEGQLSTKQWLIGLRLRLGSITGKIAVTKYTDLIDDAIFAFEDDQTLILFDRVAKLKAALRESSIGFGTKKNEIYLQDAIDEINIIERSLVTVDDNTGDQTENPLGGGEDIVFNPGETGGHLGENPKKPIGG